MAKKIMYMTTMPDSGRAQLEEISKYEMPKIDDEFIGRLNMLNGRYSAILDGQGTFVNKALACLDTILSNISDDGTAYRPVYTLVPLNLALWLYKLGCNRDKERALYAGLTKSIAKIQKYKGHEDLKMSFSDMPLSRSAKDLMGHEWRKLLPKAIDNGYLHLQALITALVCSARGRAYPVEHTIYNALHRSAPWLADCLGHIPVLQTQTGTEYRRIYLNSYTENNPLWRAMLFQVTDAYQAVVVMQNLFLKAQDVLQSNHGIGTNRISRKEFVIKLCTYLQVSSFHEARRSMAYIAMNGQQRFW